MALKVREQMVYNVLLIGETGVGKSTFINAFANYIKFPNFEEAKNAETIKVLIPTRFSIVDDNFEEHLIEEAGDANESNQSASSATQQCRTYTFKLEGSNDLIRFIDTPGVGDTRGLEQDEKNLAHMVDYIAEFSHINAIIIMLLPNNSRATVVFQYCVMQLLASLEKSAVDNIVFLFTNSRATFYKPGDTVQLLRAVLNDISMKLPHVKVPFGKSNTFCFDNEAFKFLIANKKGCSFDQDNLKGCEESWGISATVAKDLIRYIANRHPHNIANSVSLVRARAAIEKLKKPLAEVSVFIQSNIDRIGRLEAQLSDSTKDVEELRKLLNVTRIDLRVIPLDSTMNVCTHVHCTERHKMEGADIISYLSECHFPCKVRGVEKLIRSDNRMRYCSGMNNKGRANATCKKCEHHHLYHMHIDYKIEPYEIKEQDEKVKNDLNKKNMGKKYIVARLIYLRTNKEKYEKEEAIIQQSIAKFAYYLQNSAIISYNDAYEHYLLYLIDREKKSGDIADQSKIAKYEKLIKGHQEQIRILEDEFKKCREEGASGIITAADILMLINQLFELELTGRSIKDMYNAVKENMVAEFEENVHTNSGVSRTFKKAFKSVLAFTYHNI